MVYALAAVLQSAQAIAVTAHLVPVAQFAVNHALFASLLAFAFWDGDDRHRWSHALACLICPAAVLSFWVERALNAKAQP